ncbi:MAG: hypothetical protein GX902_10290 [Lentisphaerae bacterium]|jgi:hypothetical protein|nr:hypothetical protein [Lentisphaerota bacterium]
MRFNRHEKLLLLFGLLALLGLAILLLHQLPRTAPPAAPAAPQLSAAELPQTDMTLDGLRFEIDRQRKVVQAVAVNDNRIVWESRGQDRFIVPGAAFPLDLSPEGELWVANVGRKRLERLDPQTGRFISFWEPSQQFAGCCNPVRFAALSGGRFVTMEKGSRRACIYLPSGELERVLSNSLSASEHDYHLYHTADTVHLYDLHSNQHWEVPYYDSP